MNLYRPKSVDEYVGQEWIKSNLKIAAEACRMQKRALAHMLLFGPSGSGKTSLALLVSSMMGSGLHILHGPNLQKPSDIIATLTQLKPLDVVFIDEIHAMERMVEETLYPVMEDNTLNIVIGKDYSSKNVTIDLPPFSLIGATTLVSQISKPLADRFVLSFHLRQYDVLEIAAIVRNAFKRYDILLNSVESNFIAYHCRFNPRIAVNLSQRIYEYLLVKNVCFEINVKLLEDILNFLNVHYEGLSDLELAYLRLFVRSDGMMQAMSLNGIAQCLNEPVGTIINQVEPYLLMMDYIKLTPRGRVLTVKARFLLEKNVLEMVSAELYAKNVNKN